MIGDVSQAEGHAGAVRISISVNEIGFWLAVSFVGVGMLFELEIYKVSSVLLKSEMKLKLTFFWHANGCLDEVS